MKGLKVLLGIMLMASGLFSQDLIIKKDGEEINSKIIEISVDNVKFKKQDNLEGPDYILPKYDIVFVKFKDGTKEIFNVNKSSINNPDRIRKGTHLGLHVAPAYGKSAVPLYGNGKRMVDSNLTFNFSYNFGLDLNIYINDYVGIKTGINYLRIPIDYESNDSFDDGFSFSYTTNTTYKGGYSSIGIPLKLLVTTGKKNRSLYGAWLCNLSYCIWRN